MVDALDVHDLPMDSSRRDKTARLARNTGT